MLEALITGFEAVEDPRDPCRVEHRLIDILVIAACAVLGAAESFEDMADYGRCKHEWLKRFLALPNGIPSHDTFRRVLMLIDPDAFERVFLAWVRSVFTPGEAEPDRPRQVAVDGKALRHSRGAPDHLPADDSPDAGHGRLARRRVFVCRELAALPGLRGWPNVRAVL